MGNDPESVPWLAVADDYGDFVHGVFLDPGRWDHQYIHGVSDSSSFADLTAIFQKGKTLTTLDTEALTSRASSHG